MPRTLVTGGAGFLGSHLCEYLVNKEHEVICMDNLITGSKQNISGIKSRNFNFVNHNVSEFIDLDGDLDYILHFASPASPIDYLELPIQTLKVGALGTHNALGVAKAKNATFLLASTSEVYGDPLVHPQPEEYWGNVNPIGPRGVYDEAKRFAEAITMAYHRTHGINTKIVRIFNTYGPRMRIKDGRAIPNFLKQALTGEDLTIYGNGSQTRSFCYVTDLVEGIYRLLMSDQHEPVNIGNPTEMTIQQMANKILQASQSQSKIVQLPLPEDDPKTRQPNITLARKLFDWEPKVSLDEGLESTLQYFKQQINSS
ncbi:SDR family oxidoreductase [Nitrospinaceae bacterium]|nr:SDR family oxidoreductase [Nitrospinaceae bacterium]